MVVTLVKFQHIPGPQIQIVCRTVKISIVNYFVLGKSAYTTEELRAYKSLESYRLFVAGWVRDVKSYTADECQNIVIATKVSESYIHTRSHTARGRFSQQA